MIAVIFQDGSIQTMATRFTRRAQMSEARDICQGANDGVRKSEPQARIVEVEVKIIKELK